MALPTAEFGHTGHQSTRVIFGAAALGAMNQAQADVTLAVVADHGVNHIDTAASYGDAEVRLAPWLATSRASVFLATKTEERDGGPARAELERSLTRMGVDHVDLIQLHNLVEPDEWDTAFASGGAVEALVRARDEGLTRNIGVNGHGLRIAGMHRRSLARFDFDSVLLPVNAPLLAIDHYRAEVEALLGLCAERKVAVQTIKAIARRRWGDPDSSHRSWYEPLTDPHAIERGVRYILGDPQLFLNTTSDATLLPAVLAAAEGPHTRPSDEDMAADAATFHMAPLFDDHFERI
ncbi:aldo/keto reductase [soil metagenome]